MVPYLGFDIKSSISRRSDGDITGPLAISPGRPVTVVA